MTKKTTARRSCRCCLPRCRQRSTLSASHPHILRAWPLKTSVSAFSRRSSATARLRRCTRIPIGSIVYLNPCGWMEDDGQGGERMQSFKFGEPVWAPMPNHTAVRQPTSFRNVTSSIVELK